MNSAKIRIGNFALEGVCLEAMSGCVSRGGGARFYVGVSGCVSRGGEGASREEEGVASVFEVRFERRRGVSREGEGHLVVEMT